jgi:hypothetical protein
VMMMVMVSSSHIKMEITTTSTSKELTKHIFKVSSEISSVEKSTSTMMSLLFHGFMLFDTFFT